MKDNFRHHGLRQQLVDHLVEKGIKDKNVLTAILKIPSQFLRKTSSPKAIISMIRTAKQLSKTQKLTKLLFSVQSYFNILKYIVGRPYEFQIDNKVFFKLDGPIPPIEGKVNKTLNIKTVEDL